LVLLEDFGIKILLFPLVSACVCWTHDLLLRYVRALIYNEEKE
jgi:hypothetical protein